MDTQAQTIKVFQGVASRHQMFSLFDRHAARPVRAPLDGALLFDGEWFEIAESEYQYMLDMLPPHWMRGEMFAMREFMTDQVTSVFYSLRIDGAVRYFHAYCDLSDKQSCGRMRSAIIERESRPVKAMTREEKLEHIWSTTHKDYRGYANDSWAKAFRGRRTVTIYRKGQGVEWKLLEHLTDEEIASKLPVQLRHLPERIAA